MSWSVLGGCWESSSATVIAKEAVGDRGDFAAAVSCWAEEADCERCRVMVLRDGGWGERESRV